MTHRLITRGLAIVLVALTAACTMTKQEAPDLSGPSEFSTSVAVAISPDVLPQDGASQSVITLTARDAQGQPLRNVGLRVEIRVDGTPRDLGSLSARSVVTGTDGRATVVYTAPLVANDCRRSVHDRRDRRHAHWQRLQQHSGTLRVDAARSDRSAWRRPTACSRRSPLRRRTRPTTSACCSTRRRARRRPTIRS